MRFPDSKHQRNGGDAGCASGNPESLGTIGLPLKVVQEKSRVFRLQQPVRQQRIVEEQKVAPLRVNDTTNFDIQRAQNKPNELSRWRSRVRSRLRSETAG